MKTRTKASRMIYQELRWLWEHPEYSIPQWYIRLLTDAEYRQMHGDIQGALHDIEIARTARIHSINTDDIIYTDSYPLRKGADHD